MTNGLNIHDKWLNGTYTNTFVRERTDNLLVGYCWPGNSAWIDYFNEGARRFWSSLYDYSFFQGTNYLFHIWLDMNEPSVFDSTEGTLPKDALHYSSL